MTEQEIEDLFEHQIHKLALATLKDHKSGFVVMKSDIFIDAELEVNGVYVKKIEIESIQSETSKILGGKLCKKLY